MVIAFCCNVQYLRVIIVNLNFFYQQQINIQPNVLNTNEKAISTEEFEQNVQIEICRTS